MGKGDRPYPNIMENTKMKFLVMVIDNNTNEEVVSGEVEKDCKFSAEIAMSIQFKDMQKYQAKYRKFTDVRIEVCQLGDKVYA